MTVSGGSGGWTGAGYTEILYLKNTRVAVELKGAVVNDCYELVGGTIVSAYDPNWGGLQDVTQLVNLLQDAITQLVDIYTNYTGTQAERDKINQLNNQICNGISNNNQLTAEQKAQLAVDCQTYQTQATAFTACYAANHPESTTSSTGKGRVAAGAAATAEQVCKAPDLSSLTDNLSNAVPPAAKDSNDILVGQRHVILAKGTDTLAIDELKVVFKTGYKFTYDESARKLTITPPGKSPIAYGIAFDKVTGRFTGFYKLDYLQANSLPCTLADKKIGYENKKGATACQEGYLLFDDPTAYEEIYDAYPANVITGSALNLLTERKPGKDPLWTGQENGYTLKLFVTDLNTTSQNRAAIAKAANKPGTTDINLWIDYGANGQIRYEYFFGSKITAKNPNRLAHFFEAWLQKIKPAPSMGAENPIAQVIAGVANFVDSIQVPRKYWDCNLTGKYVQLPWISDASGAPAYLITQEDWAYYCGLYNGTINVIGGLPLFLNMLIDDQQRSQLWSELKQLNDIEVSEQTVTKVFQLVYNPAQKCATAYNRGYAIPTVFSLFVGIGELNLLGKAKSAISTLASMARKLPAVGVGIRKAALAGTLVLGMATSSGAFQNLPVTLKALTTTVQSAVKITGRVEQLTDEVVATANSLAATGNRGVLGVSELTAEGLTKTIAGAEDLIIFQAPDKLAMGVEIINQAQQKTFSVLAFFSAVGGVVTSYVNTNPSTNNCSICTGRAMPTSLCTKLSTLSSRGGTSGRSGVEKLCSSIPDNTRLEAIADKLNSFSPDEVSAFLGDIQGATCSADYLCGNVSSLTPELIEAWKVVYDIGSGRGYHIDFPLIQKVREIRTNQQKLNAFTNPTFTVKTLPEFLDSYNFASCNTCGTATGLSTYFRNLDEILDNTLKGHQNYWTFNTGFQGFYQREPFAARNTWSKDGGQHMLRALQTGLLLSNGTRLNLSTSNIIGFDQAFGGTVSPNKQYDIRLQANSPVTFIEFKSYQEDSNIDVDQLLGYLNNVNSLGNLLYVFNERKLTTQQARMKMQGVFTSNRANDIFDTIWNNSNLRLSTFPNRPNTPQGRNGALQDFNAWSQDAQNPIFDFTITN